MFEHIARSVEGEVGRLLAPLREAASRWSATFADMGGVSRSVEGSAVLDAEDALNLNAFSGVAR